MQAVLFHVDAGQAFTKLTVGRFVRLIVVAGIPAQAALLPPLHDTPELSHTLKTALFVPAELVQPAPLLVQLPIR